MEVWYPYCANALSRKLLRFGFIEPELVGTII